MQSLDNFSKEDREQEQSLHNKFRTLEENRKREKLKPKDQQDLSHLSKIELEIGDLRIAKKKLEQEFSKKYPRFTDLRKPAVITIEEFQRDILGPDEGLISYWIGEKNIIGIFSIKGGTRLLHDAPLRHAE